MQLITFQKFNPNIKEFARFSAKNSGTFHCRLSLGNVIVAIPWIRMSSPFAAWRMVPARYTVDWILNDSWNSVLLTLRANPTKWSNTLKQFVGKLPTNCLSVFDHFVKLLLKGLTPIALSETLMNETKSSICCGRDRLFDKLDASLIRYSHHRLFGWC